MKFPTLAVDTANHVVYGGAIALAATLAATALGQPATAIAGVAVLAFAAGKEGGRLHPRAPCLERAASAGADQPGAVGPVPGAPPASAGDMGRSGPGLRRPVGRADGLPLTPPGAG